MRVREDRDYKKARKRLDRVTETQVQMWADSALWSLQSGLDGFRATSDVAALREARTGALGLLAAVDSLLDRNA